MSAQGGDLLAWLDHAITRREQTARAAADAVGGPSWDGSERDVSARDSGDTVADGVMYGDRYEPMRQEACDHIALNDPESVLRRCAADRKLISQHGPCSDTDRGCKGCGFDNQEESMVDDYNSCPVLIAIAEGYGWTEGER